MRAVALLAGAITACALSAWSAAASDQRARLVGYQDFEFGASEADVRARIKVRKEESDKSGGIWLYSTETDQIDGNAYSLDFNVKDGSLVQVNLSRSSGENPVACALTFADVLAHLQSKYGAPDERPDLYKTARVFTGLATFTFNDGGSIVVMGFSAGANSVGCTHSVAYASGLGKDTF